MSSRKPEVNGKRWRPSIADSGRQASKTNQNSTKTHLFSPHTLSTRRQTTKAFNFLIRARAVEGPSVAIQNWFLTLSSIQHITYLRKNTASTQSNLVMHLTIFFKNDTVPLKLQRRRYRPNKVVFVQLEFKQRTKHEKHAKMIYITRTTPKDLF